MSADPFLVALGLFRALEDVADSGQELPDPTVTSLLDAAEDEIGIGGLYSGWALVAARLRLVILDHAAELGCDCGSLRWLEQEQLYYAERDNAGIADPEADGS
jgi:hypothetical protein